MDINGTINAETLNGTEDPDTIHAGDGDDILNGNGGDDQLHGEGGNDTLDGGAGNDTLIGGTGNDVYIIGAGDGVIEAAGEGTDEIRTTADWGLGGIPDVENLTAIGTGNVFLGGNNGANVLTGNVGDNYIVGEGGSDTIDGGAGKDVASFQLPEGLTGSVRQVAGAGADEGRILIQLVDGENVQTWARVTVTGIGSATVEGVGIGAFLGTDTVSNVEDMHFFVANSPDFENQFTNILLAAVQYGGFVSGGESGDTINLADFPGATDTNGNGGHDAITGTADANYLIGGAGNDSIDGAGGIDTAAFHLPEGTAGTVRQVAGTGADEGKILIQLVNGEDVQTWARLTVIAPGSATVEGVGIGAFLGTDTLTNVERVDFMIAWDGPVPEGQLTNVSLAAQQFGDFVGGGAAGDTIDLAAFPGAINANGNGGDDLITGTAEANSLSGNDGNDTVSGGDGHDVLRGNAGDDILNGDGGNDILIGGGGNDALNGGAGVDRISLYNEINGVTVDLRLDGVAQDFGVMGVDTLDSIEQVLTTYWSDTVFGNDAANWVFAAAGNDYVATFAGDDYVTLGYGDKIVEGGDGNDTVEITDDAFEPLYTADGITVSLLLQGQAQATGVGNWTLTGIENLSGFWGSDDFTGDGNANILAGADGDDTLSGGGGNDILMGDGAMVLGTPFDQNAYQFVADLVSIGFAITEGHDVLRGGAGDDELYGSGGDDFLVGGIGNDLIDGGAGIDRVSLFDDGTGGFGITVDLRLEGVAQDFGPLGFDTLYGIEHVNTTYNDDLVNGNEAANWIWTYSGFDRLYGHGGDDLFTVGLGTKVIDGGDGSDTVEISDEAWEPLYTADGITVSLALQGQAQATGVGDWTLSGIENLSGNFGNDDFTGDESANILAGFGGDDTLTGAGGDDILMGDGAITLGEVEGSPGEMVFLHDLVTAGFTITEGNDILSGGAGNDTLYGGGGNDSLDGGADDDDLQGGAGDDFLSGADGHDILRGQAGHDTLYGGSGDDVLIGNGGSDVLHGGDGIDRLSLFDGSGTFGVTVDLRLEGVAQDFGALGADTITGFEQVNTTFGSDTVHGTEGGNWIWTYAGTDTLFGHGGDDYFTVGYGTKVIDGGDGSDTVEIDDTDSFDPVYTSAGLTVSLALQGQVQATEVGNWTLTGIENLSGNFGDDHFTGDGNANILAGLGGNDTLIGAGGDDVLMGDGAMWVGNDPDSPNSFEFLPDFLPTSFTIYPGDDTLDGGAGNDTLYGALGNDVLHGGADNDTLDGGGGLDQLFGDDGNDTLIVRDAIVSTEIYNGGLGTDTLEFRAVSAFTPITGYGATGANISGIEQIKFGSTADIGVSVSILLNQINSSGIHTLIGGEGRDNINVVAAGPGGIFTMPNFTLVDWTPSLDPDVPGDRLVLFAAGNGAFTLNAREGLAANQILVGAAGDDTLNGSSGTDLLNGMGGINVLNGNDGDDVLIIANTVTQQGTTPFFTGLGSSFNGGNGTDTLSVGGEVYFEGTLSSVEGIHLQPAIVSTAPNGSGGQVAAVLEMDLAHFAMLPTAFFVDGTGTIDIDLGEGEGFDFSAVVFQPGANVRFEFDGESDGGVPVAVTWIGTSNGDYFDFGSDIVTVTGGGGADIFALEPDEESSLDVTIADFTIGEDKVDLSDTGITGGQRLSDFISQVGDDVVIAGASGGQTFNFVLQNTLLEDLSEDDFIFGDWDGAEIDTGTEFDDILFGFAGDDVLTGAGGNDRLYSGGGSDQLFGDAGNDTIIIDELFTGGSFNGGADSDTLELRASGYNQSNAAGPSTVYTFFQSTLSGIEKVKFASNDEAGVGASMVLGQVAGAGISELIGGEGIDTFSSIVVAPPAGGTFTMPNFTLTNWTTTATPWVGGSDALLLIVGAPGNYTLNAREGLASVQVLVGGIGNDTLNGSSGSDALLGQAGSNVLNGNGGDDVLVIANSLNQLGELTAFTGAGSTFNGGTGHDTLSIGGVVEFAGTLSSIERVHLQEAFTSAAPNGQGTQAAAQLFITGDAAGALAADLVLSGEGLVAVDLDPGDVYDASGWTIEAGSTVTVHVTGSSQADTITLGAFAETVDDDGGTDTAVFAGNRGDYVAAAGPGGSITIGDDTFSGIELFQFADGTFFWNGASLVSAVSEGLVADGYIANATVYIDGNNNGVLDADEPFTITDANGDFTLISPFVGPLRAFGGTNIDTGRPNSVQLSAPDGASVINPLTTLVQSIAAASSEPDPAVALAAAETAVKSAFGIDPTLSLSTVDLIAAATADPALALSAQKAAASVAEVLSVVTNAGGDSQAALGELGSLVSGGGAVDLTDGATLTQVVSSAVTGDSPAGTSDIVAVVQGGTQAISTATSVAEVTAAQLNQLPTAGADSASLNENGNLAVSGRANGVLGNDLDPDTGETVLLRVSKAQGAAATATTVATSGATSVQGAYGTLQISADGSYSYTANGAAAEALSGGALASDVFTYTVIDPAGDTVTATLTFNLTGVDDAPVAVNDAVSVADNATTAGASLFGNDVDVDGPALTVATVNGSAASIGSQITLASGARLTVNADGTYSYDPNGQFNHLVSTAKAAATGALNSSATDSFTYGVVGGGTATVTVTVTGFDGAGDELRGDANDNAIVGTAGADIVLTYAGNDVLDGGAGADAMTGGLGDDTYHVDNSGDLVVEAAGQGLDRVHASVGYELAAGADIEVLLTANSAGTEAINLYGNGIANSIYGNAGGNVLSGAGGNDYVVGLAGHDTLYGGDGADALDGGAGHDVLLGGDGADYLAGGEGNDLINGDAGLDTLVGGIGDDTYYVDGLGDLIVEAAGEGFDRVISTGSFELGAASQVEVMQFADLAGTAALSLYGSDIANTLYGNAGGNVLAGGGGADYVVGLGGNDTLYGGDGADALDGGEGQDVLLGGEGNDYLVGGADNDLIQGDAGTDNMFGGTGDDTYYVDVTGDLITEAAGEGFDRVISTGSYELGASSQVEVMQFADLAGTAAHSLYGSDIGNSIYGNAGGNVLAGLGGDDYLAGLGGADTLYGGAGNDAIDGGEGSDVLFGGAGADYLVGGAGGDYFAFFDALGGGNADTIADMTVGSDLIALDDAVFAGLGVGSLAAGAFVAGTAAGDADDRIIYDSASGQLWFDADGSGAGAAVLFAGVSPGVALTSADFVVV